MLTGRLWPSVDMKELYQHIMGGEICFRDSGNRARFDCLVLLFCRARPARHRRPDCVFYYKGCFPPERESKAEGSVVYPADYRACAGRNFLTRNACAVSRFNGWIKQARSCGYTEIDKKPARDLIPAPALLSVVYSVSFAGAVGANPATSFKSITPASYACFRV